MRAASLDKSCQRTTHYNICIYLPIVNKCTAGPSTGARTSRNDGQHNVQVASQVHRCKSLELRCKESHKVQAQTSWAFDVGFVAVENRRRKQQQGSDILQSSLFSFNKAQTPSWDVRSRLPAPGQDLERPLGQSTSIDSSVGVQNEPRFKRPRLLTCRYTRPPSGDTTCHAAPDTHDRFFQAPSSRR